MKVAFLGFKDFPEQQKALEEILTNGGHKIAEKPEEAHVLMIPHHLDELFPPEKPWIAVWITGGSARIPEFKEMTNPPRDLIDGETPEWIRNTLGSVVLEVIAKIQSE